MLQHRRRRLTLPPSLPSGRILTKLDGNFRGGAAVSIRGVSGKLIKFTGIGERAQDLEPFYPDWMASHILGMSDVISLLERALMEVTDADAARMWEKMAKAKFNFNDFMAQSKLVLSMGSMAGVAKMLPRLRNMINNSQLRTFFFGLFCGEHGMPREWHSCPSLKR